MPHASTQPACVSRHRREHGVGAGSAVDLGQLLVGGALVVVGLARLEAPQQLGVAAFEAVEVVVVVERRLQILRRVRCVVAHPARRRGLVVLGRLLGRARGLLVGVERRCDGAEVGGRRLERREGLALLVLLQRRLEAGAVEARVDVEAEVDGGVGELCDELGELVAREDLVGVRVRVRVRVRC